RVLLAFFLYICTRSLIPLPVMELVHVFHPKPQRNSAEFVRKSWFCGQNWQRKVWDEPVRQVLHRPRPGAHPERLSPIRELQCFRVRPEPVVDHEPWHYAALPFMLVVPSSSINTGPC